MGEMMSDRDQVYGSKINHRSLTLVPYVSILNPLDVRDEISSFDAVFAVLVHREAKRFISNYS